MSKFTPFAGSLYQLFAPYQVANRAYVGVNGPHDKYGVVTSSEKQPDGQYLHQIRGVKARPGEKVVHNF